MARHKRPVATFGRYKMNMVARLLALLVILGPMLSLAQPIDGIIGMKRVKVQQLLRPYHILDYQRDRVVYQFDKGIKQTVLYINDTCTSFYWIVNTPQMEAFVDGLKNAGYVRAESGLLTKNGQVVSTKTLESGKAALLAVSIGSGANPQVVAQQSQPERKTRISKEKAQTAENKSRRKPDRYANVPMMRGGPVVIDLPLMQQEAKAERENPTPKVKDPKRNWVGDERGNASLLGWGKE